MKEPSLSEHDVASLMRAVAWVAQMEVEVFSREHPQAAAWTDIWAELRQSYGPRFPEDAQHRTALVMCWRNKRTRKTKEATLVAGSGHCPTCTVLDLLAQLQKEVPEAFDVRPVGLMSLTGLAYPVGMLGMNVLGRA